MCVDDAISIYCVNFMRDGISLVCVSVCLSIYLWSVLNILNVLSCLSRHHAFHWGCLLTLWLYSSVGHNWEFGTMLLIFSAHKFCVWQHGCVEKKKSSPSAFWISTLFYVCLSYWCVWYDCPFTVKCAFQLTRIVLLKDPYYNDGC